MPYIPDYNGPVLDELTFSEEEIEKMLTILNKKSAVGPDRINNTALFQTCRSIAKPLVRLFLSIMTEAVIPKSWKLSFITPIFKSGDHSEGKNYRSISLLSCLSKSLEKLIHSHLTNHLLQNKLISTHQFGFLPKSSTVTQGLEIVNNIHTCMDSNFFTKTSIFWTLASL